ncbi:MAG: hypothetical protein NZ989_07095 [Bacteroidia bacterium]|nr:hypothetical protein [Bacteroidia bacterium]MDW8058047.1 hypothetical protein [Bacteroidia bacterium]
MMRDIKIFGLLLSLSLLGFAQPSGEKAVGTIIAKDGLRAISARFASPSNPTLNLALTAGIESGRGLTGGIALQQYLNYGGACAAGACRRSSINLAPYIEGGLRLRRGGENAQVDVVGHIGGGVLLPLGPVEAFAQANLYTAVASMRPQVDLAGGLRIRF